MIISLFKDKKIVNENEYQTYLNELNNVVFQILSTFIATNMLHHYNSAIRFKFSFKRKEDSISKNYIKI
ncbi:hypothetical protein [Mycoplasmopsis fermentans]|uniref:hypothetical protein n=1 Tax=Mycoplasmopsis fermentans TaxID=2115 RepID=UPI0001E330B4|nr:hypothetical protein [Mycoplasmopsis fermentans]ADN69431.1 hypothetical protein MFE_08720 [Mycoplasmopsis fermentans JER]